jgi:hypothetical protein
MARNTKYPMPKSLDELLWLAGEIKGFDQGTNERADILTQAADGSDINEIWQEIQRLLTLWNTQRDPLVSRLVYNVSEPIENVGIPSGADFEEASEYGQPTGIRGFDYKNRGFDFKFYDLAVRYTWMFLAEAGRAQIENLANMALEADNRLIFNKVMKTLFNPANLAGIADANIPTTVYKFYNGDGEVPPQWKNNTFTGSHTHYSTSLNLGAASGVFVAADLDAVEDDLIKHGYGPNNGATLVVMVNRQEGAVVRKFRVDAATNPGRYDFIPNANYGGGVFVAPRLQGTPELIARPQGNVPGSIGTYGPFHIVEEEYVPPGYVAVLASGGPDSLMNPIGMREHRNAAYRGLQIIPGQRSDYPLTDSFYRRGFGTGVRQRGAGFIFQVVNSATYTVPAIYA